MFNLYTFEKKEAEKHLFDDFPISGHRSITRDKLATRYRHRINENLLMLNEQSIKLPSRKGSPIEILSFRSTVRNSNNSKSKNSKTDYVYDPTPSPTHAFKLRQRNKLKEIQPSLKFKFFGNERLKECLNKQKKFLETSTGPSFKSSSNNYTEKFSFNGGKNVMGYYHYKIHFKTIESLALYLHSSIRNSSKIEIDKQRKEKNLGIRRESKSVNEIDKIPKEEIIPLSSEVLEKYGVWKKVQKQSLY